MTADIPGNPGSAAAVKRWCRCVCNNHPAADGTTMCVSCINKGDRRNG